MAVRHLDNADVRYSILPSLTLLARAQGVCTSVNSDAGVLLTGSRTSYTLLSSSVVSNVQVLRGGGVC